MIGSVSWAEGEELKDNPRTPLVEACFLVRRKDGEDGLGWSRLSETDRASREPGDAGRDIRGWMTMIETTDESEQRNGGGGG